MIVGSEGTVSREGGRAFIRRHGPGESPDSNGDGNGVTSPMAVMIGLGTRELAAEPRLRAKAADFRLGVREILCFRFGPEDLRESVGAAALGEPRSPSIVERVVGLSTIGERLEKE